MIQDLKKHNDNEFKIIENEKSYILNDMEVNFLMNILDQIEIKGLANINMVLNIYKKLNNGNNLIICE